MCCGDGGGIDLCVWIQEQEVTVIISISKGNRRKYIAFLLVEH